MAKFRFATDGFVTLMELDGKAFGKGVQGVEFRHTGGDRAILKLEIDVHSFGFMQEGEYNKKESVLMGNPDQHATEDSDDLCGLPPVITAV